MDDFFVEDSVAVEDIPQEDTEATDLGLTLAGTPRQRKEGAGRKGRKKMEKLVPTPLVQPEPEEDDEDDEPDVLDLASAALGFDAAFPEDAKEPKTQSGRNRDMLNKLDGLRHPTSEVVDLAMVDIVLDERLQPRINMNIDVMKQYSEEMLLGDVFPPVIVYQDIDTLYLADGWHRYQAVKLIGREFITAEVRPGTFRDAVFFAATVNASHGLRRSNEDKRRAVTRLLVDHEWGKMTNMAIARHLRVSDRFVGIIRSELIASGDVQDLTTRYTMDGYPVNTAPIADARRREKEERDEFANPDDPTIISTSTGEPLGAGVSREVKDASTGTPYSDTMTEDESHYVRAFDAVASLIPVLYVDPRNAVGTAQLYRREKLILVEERIAELKEWVLTFESAVETAKNLRGN
jgi:hypothetical protein